MKFYSKGSVLDYDSKKTGFNSYRRQIFSTSFLKELKPRATVRVLKNANCEIHSSETILSLYVCIGFTDIVTLSCNAWLHYYATHRYIIVQCIWYRVTMPLRSLAFYRKILYLVSMPICAQRRRINALSYEFADMLVAFRIMWIIGYVHHDTFSAKPMAQGLQLASLAITI